MGAFLGFAYILFVFGPAFIFYVKFVSKTPETNLIAISSAFVWLVSVMPPSILQVINGGVEDNVDFIPLYIFITVLFQQIGRYLYVKGYFYAEAQVFNKGKLDKSLFSDLPVAISAGFGIGVLNALVFHGGALSGAFAERDNGDFFALDTCNGLSMYFISAWHALQYQVLHIALSILTFHAFRQHQLKRISLYQLRVKFLGVASIHMLAAMLSSLNLLKKGCDAEIPLVFITIVSTCVYTYKTVRGASYSLYGEGQEVVM